MDITSDGKTLYAVNMGNGKIVKLDISGVSYGSIPSGGYTGSSLPVSEISIPSSVATCSGGRFRPSALSIYAGSMYIGGVCDASTGGSPDLKLKILKMDLTSGTWTELLNYGLSAIQGGSLRWAGWPNVKWSDNFVGQQNTDGEFQPYVNDIALTDNGSVIIGVGNRKIFSMDSDRDMGYMLTTWRNADGTMSIESNGKVGPYTSQARTDPAVTSSGLNTGWSSNTKTSSDLNMVSMGPGGDWFLEVGRTISHPFLFNGGVFIASGTGEVLGGFADPLDGDTNAGGRYLSISNEVANYGNSITSHKTFAITGMQAVCAATSIEIGNRVWNDTDGNGRQDPDEPALANVTVTLKSSTGATLATAKTDGTGTYIFSNASGTSSANLIYNITALTASASYSVTIDNASSQTALAGMHLTLANVTNGTEDQRDSDGTLVGTNVIAALTTGAPGANNHSYDFGFTACSMNVVVTAGACLTATNQYTVSGTVSFTNAAAGTMTITDGTRSTTVPVSATSTSVPFSLTGLTSGTGSHTVVATLSGCSTDNATYTAPASCSVTPCNLTIGTNSLPNGTVGAAYNQTIKTTGGTAPLTYAVSVGSLPAGLSLNATTGAITGTPGGAGTATFTIQVTDSKSCSATVPLTITVGTVAVCSLNLTVTRGDCFSATNQYSITGIIDLVNNTAGGTITITDGTATTTVQAAPNAAQVTFTLSGFNSDGSQHTVTATMPGCGSDQDVYFAPASCSVTPCTLAISTSSLPNGTVGTAYNQTIQTTGGTAPLTFAVSVGSLPAGLSLNPTKGAIKCLCPTVNCYPTTVKKN
ncbi:putative Ig domain-containing protein [Spirosoma linguale]|uniref:Ig family protein n=1 Tax=Spirosoma linguale (strain ATCC 33905 / DSM 74 / LMG 10896 / Claus 1) TaxID=504472 RepID=D2QCD9_SPILD|nr:Ig family protein [Spirosoma linguale DSM 74]